MPHAKGKSFQPRPECLGKRQREEPYSRLFRKRTISTTAKRNQNTSKSSFLSDGKMRLVSFRILMSLEILELSTRTSHAPADRDTLNGTTGFIIYGGRDSVDRIRPIFRISTRSQQ
jgi:hypothetical protein